MMTKQMSQQPQMHQSSFQSNLSEISGINSSISTIGDYSNVFDCTPPPPGQLYDGAQGSGQQAGNAVGVSQAVSSLLSTVDRSLNNGEKLGLMNQTFMATKYQQAAASMFGPGQLTTSTPVQDNEGLGSAGQGQLRGQQQLQQQGLMQPPMLLQHPLQSAGQLLLYSQVAMGVPVPQQAQHHLQGQHIAGQHFQIPGMGHQQAGVQMLQQQQAVHPQQQLVLQQPLQFIQPGQMQQMARGLSNNLVQDLVRDVFGSNMTGGPSNNLALTGSGDQNMDTA